MIIGRRKPNQAPEFGWLNTILGNLKTSFSGTYHAFDFAKYGSRYLAAFAYRFNRRFHLDRPWGARCSLACSQSTTRAAWRWAKAATRD